MNTSVCATIVGFSHLTLPRNATSLPLPRYRALRDVNVNQRAWLSVVVVLVKRLRRSV